jgi:hypothetical protein|nr:MAG TPA: hypothetical protein [Caudoviricetes sp.]
MSKKNKHVVNTFTQDVSSKITQDKNAEKNVKNEYVFNNPAVLAFDYSFEGLYYSVKLSNNRFNNFLKSEKEFVEKFRQIRKVSTTLSGEKFTELLRRRNTHCHEIDKKKKEIVLTCIGRALAAVGKTDNIQEQIDHQFGDEPIYQIGLDKGVRLIGTHDAGLGIFRVFLIDYHHDLYPDEKRTKHGSKELKFCPMKSD